VAINLRLLREDEKLLIFRMLITIEGKLILKTVFTGLLLLRKNSGVNGFSL